MLLRLVSSLSGEVLIIMVPLDVGDNGTKERAGAQVSPIGTRGLR